MLVAGAGTGGTITGIARKLKEKCPNIKVGRLYLELEWSLGKVLGSWFINGVCRADCWC